MLISLPFHIVFGKKSSPVAKLHKTFSALNSLPNHFGGVQLWFMIVIQTDTYFMSFKMSPADF